MDKEKLKTYRTVFFYGIGIVITLWVVAFTLGALTHLVVTTFLAGWKFE